MAIKTVDPVSYEAPVEMNPVATGEAMSTKQRLDAMEKVTVRIPLPKGMTKASLAAMVEKGEKPPMQVVGINGYNYQIAQGYDVVVPVVVKDLLEEAGII